MAQFEERLQTLGARGVVGHLVSLWRLWLTELELIHSAEEHVDNIVCVSA